MNVGTRGALPRGRAERLRVLAAIDGLHLAGAEKLLVGLAERSAASGIELGVVSLDPPADEASVVPELVAAGARVWTLDAARLLDAGALLRLVGLIRAFDADVVHAHLRYAATLAPPAARIAGRPVVTTFHHVPGPTTPRERVKEAIAVSVARTGQAVLAVSRAQAHAFGSRYRLRPGSWHVVPNGIDLKAFQEPAAMPPDLRRRVGDGPVVALVARLRAGKGHAAALACWERVRRQVPDAHLLMVGDGPLEDEVARDVARRGLGAGVTLTGARRDVPAIMAAADLVLLASDSEALPTVLIEAAAAGTPAVATDVGGVREVVQDGRTGRLVPPGDPTALATAIVDLLHDAPTRRSLGDEARRVATERFGLEVWADELATIYRRLAAHRRSTR